MTQDRMLDLATRAQKGDRAAFDALLEKCRDRLESYVRSRIGNHLQTHLQIEDAIQETCARAFESITRFQWEGYHSFLRWLKTITDRVILEAVRRQKKGAALRLDRELIASNSTPSKALRRNERFDRLESSLNSLSPDYREVVILALIEGRQIKDIAKRMDRSPDAVRKLLSRALKTLKDTFGETRSFSLPHRSLRREEGGSHVGE